MTLYFRTSVLYFLLQRTGFFYKQKLHESYHRHCRIWLQLYSTSSQVMCDRSSASFGDPANPSKPVCMCVDTKHINHAMSMGMYAITATGLPFTSYPSSQPPLPPILHSVWIAAVELCERTTPLHTRVIWNREDVCVCVFVRAYVGCSIHGAVTDPQTGTDFVWRKLYVDQRYYLTL